MGRGHRTPDLGKTTTHRRIRCTHRRADTPPQVDDLKIRSMDDTALAQSPKWALDEEFSGDAVYASLQRIPLRCEVIERRADEQPQRAI